MEDVIRVDCFTESIIHKVSTIYVKEPLIHSPEDFITGQTWGSKILITSDILASPLLLINWSWIVQHPEALDWNVVISILQHLKAPRLFVIASNVTLPARMIQTLVSRGLESIDTSVIIYRSIYSPEQPISSHICFLPPVSDTQLQTRIMSITHTLMVSAVGATAGSAINMEPVVKVYQELVQKNMWMAIQLTPSTAGVISDFFKRTPTIPTLHWFQPGATLDEINIIDKFKQISKTLAGFFASLAIVS